MGKDFGIEELEAESTLVIVAGSNTSFTALASAYFYLAHYPEILEHAAKEVRMQSTNFGELRSGPKLSSCYYLRARLDEAMRLSADFIVIASRIPWRLDQHRWSSLSAGHQYRYLDLLCSSQC